MAEYFELVVHIPDQGWRLMALFRHAADCEAIAALMRVGWRVQVACVLNTGA